MSRAAGVFAVVSAAVLFAAPAHADVDTDFADRLHGHGIYGPRDHNAWIGKITCERLGNGVDRDAHDSAAFVGANVTGGDRQRAWQFVGAALSTYCPDKLTVLEQAGVAR